MTTPIRIDLVSDTATRPSPGIRQAMAEAKVGDEQRGEDPTTNALCERVADMLGQDAAMFLPSGVMCNHVAMAVHCEPGDEIIAAEKCHIWSSEGAGAAVFCGSLIRSLPTEDGVFTAEQLKGAINQRKPKAPRSRLVHMEQTVNRGGGTVWPLATVQSVAEIATANGLKIHMDGARLLNAVVASGVSARDYGSPCDSVWLDLSKGLGCPFGGVLAGSRAFMDEAWRWKFRFGGGMRQSGMMAAAGLYALDNNIDQLASDHDNARLFAELISQIPGIALEFEETATNLVFFNITGTGLSTDDVSDALEKRGIRIGCESDTCMRAVTHMDVSRADIKEAAAALKEITSDGDTHNRAAE